MLTPRSIVQLLRFDFTPQLHSSMVRSFLDVEGVDMGLSKEEIVDFVYYGRK